MEFFCAGILGIWHYNKYRKLQEGSYVHTDVYTSARCTPKLKNTAQTILKKLDYIPPIYCIFEYHGQLQTFMQFVSRNLTRLCRSFVLTNYSIKFRRELLHLPDGGTIALDWARKGNEPEAHELLQNAPIVILHHGLVGDSQSEYIYHMSWTLLSAGYRVVVMVARGCGGMELTSGEIFAGRRTADVSNCVDHVKHLYPHAKLFWVGFSLGAALTLQYLAVPHANRQQPEDVYATYGYPSSQWTGPLTAAVCVSPPWDVAMNACNPSYITHFWMSMVVIPLKLYYLSHRSYLNKVAPETIGGISLWRLLLTRSMADFDELMYKTHQKNDGGKYATLRDYYDDISPVHSAGLVQTPTIVLTAKDDPLCMHSHAPTDPLKIGPGLVVVRHIIIFRYLYFLN